MSKETREWLSNNVLIGFTEKRGNAWHYMEGDDNHYVGPVPVEDVQRRLFHWHPEEHPLHVEVGKAEYLHVPGRKAIVRSDTQHVLGVFKEGYHPHPYSEWLVSNVANALGELHIGSAGLLKGGAVAWVQAEMPENVTTVDGVEFRPFFNAFSSLDGTFASTYKTGVTNVVCDNTMRAAQNEAGPQVKIKSTKNSAFRAQEVRDALGIVHAIADDFAAQVHMLCSTDFTDRQFEKLVDGLSPMPDADTASKRAITMAETRRDKFWSMWRHDPRVSPWNGTAWGAWQAFNTYATHEATAKGGNRVERNMLRSISGQTDDADAKVLGRIESLAAESFTLVAPSS